MGKFAVAPLLGGHLIAVNTGADGILDLITVGSEELAAKYLASQRKIEVAGRIVFAGKAKVSPKGSRFVSKSGIEGRCPEIKRSSWRKKSLCVTESAMAVIDGLIDQGDLAPDAVKAALRACR